MFCDEFKSRYTTLPFATFKRVQKKEEIKKSVITLLHDHKELELMAVLDGKASVSISSEIYEIKKGDIVIISPYLLHSYTLFENCDFSHICLCFDMNIIPDKKLTQELESGISRSVGIIKSNNNASEILFDKIKNAYDAHKEQKNGWELRVIGSLCEFFGILKENDYIIKNENEKYQNNICRQIIDYINCNYSQKITSSDVARTLFISNSYFCRIFKKNFGQPFQNYLCEYRIEKAKAHLKSTELSISETAMSVGFNSFSFFTKKFREYSGQTPSEYRRKNLKNSK